MITSAHQARRSAVAAAGNLATSSEVQSFYGDHADLDSAPYKPVTFAALRGDGALAYARLDKQWGPDYKPAVYSADVNGHPSLFLHLSNDGGDLIYVFAPPGKLLASGSQGESGDFTWDTPPQMPAKPGS